MGDIATYKEDDWEIDQLVMMSTTSVLVPAVSTSIDSLDPPESESPVLTSELDPPSEQSSNPPSEGGLPNPPSGDLD